MNRLDRLILASLREHPHADTPAQLHGSLAGVEIDTVVASLEALRSEGLVHGADDHWQLTAAGWRVQRAA